MQNGGCLLLSEFQDQERTAGGKAKSCKGPQGPSGPQPPKNSLFWRSRAIAAGKLRGKKKRSFEDAVFLESVFQTQLHNQRQRGREEKGGLEGGWLGGGRGRRERRGERGGKNTTHFHPSSGGGNLQPPRVPISPLPSTPLTGYFFEAFGRLHHFKKKLWWALGIFLNSLG